MARVQLAGKLSSGGSTFTIANKIMPTLKQFRSVRWVKIYDQAGQHSRSSAPRTRLYSHRNSHGVPPNVTLGSRHRR